MSSPRCTWPCSEAERGGGTTAACCSSCLCSSTIPSGFSGAGSSRWLLRENPRPAYVRQTNSSSNATTSSMNAGSGTHAGASPTTWRKAAPNIARSSTLPLLAASTSPSEHFSGFSRELAEIGNWTDSGEAGTMSPVTHDAPLPLAAPSQNKSRLLRCSTNVPLPALDLINDLHPLHPLHPLILKAAIGSVSD